MDTGHDLEMMKPLKRDGHLDREGVEVFGCHAGPFEHYNVVNPEPGHVYYYALRTSAGIRKVTRQGWRVVGPDDPEQQLPATDPNFAAAGLDSTKGSTELVLCKMSESRYAQRQAEFQKLNAERAAYADPSHEWEEKGRVLEAEYGRFRSKGGEPFYFKQRGHGITRE